MFFYFNEWYFFFRGIVGSSESGGCENTNNNKDDKYCQSEKSCQTESSVTIETPTNKSKYKQMLKILYVSLQNELNKLTHLLENIPLISKWLKIKHKLCQHKLGCLMSLTKVCFLFI